MNILNRFTVRSLLLNKKRTIVTIIGIILSTAMICATAGLITTFQNTMVEYTKKNSGDYYVRFSDVKDTDIDNIIQNGEVKSSMISQEVGYAEFKESQNEYKPYFYIKEYDSNALENYDINLISGRLPQNSNEVLISESIETDGGKKYNVGDKLTVDIGVRKIDDEILNQQNPLILDETEGDNVSETFEKLYTKEYEIVGVTKRLDSEPYSAPGYTLISKLEKYNNEVDLFIKTKSAKKVFDFAKEINGVADINDNGKYETNYNNELLRYMGVSYNENVNSMLYGVASVVISIIMVTSIFVIRNSFSISVTERFKQYGMLASIGATPKQIKRNVLFEGIVLGLIAVPLGILGGTFAVYVLVKITEGLLASSLNGVSFVYSIPLIAICISCVLSFVTIILSALVPGIKASKISPIDAIRSSNDIKIKGKKLKTSKLFNKLFGIEGQIAVKNLKRSRKKYRTTVISIFVSIVVFISLNTVIDYGFKMSNMYYEDLGYNISISGKRHMGDQEEINAKMLNYYSSISKLNNINEYSVIKSYNFTCDKKYLSTRANEIYSEDEFANVEILSVGKEEYEKYLKELGLDVSKCSQKGILIDNINSYYDSKYVGFNYLNVKEGEKIELTEDDKKSTIEIVKRAKEAPMGVMELSDTAYVIVSDEFIDKYNYHVQSMNINSDNPDKLIEDIENMDKEMYNEVYINNYDEYMKQNDALILVMSIFLYGFITVISLIGVTNIFNTITTNMALRSNEFAVLKSIGMTDKEFSKMINIESVLYGFKSLLYGIPVGLGLSYLIYNNITEMYDTKYSIPVMPVLICIIFVFVIIFFAMGYSKKKINEQNIIETIRNENI